MLPCNKNKWLQQDRSGYLYPRKKKSTQAALPDELGGSFARLDAIRKNMVCTQSRLPTLIQNTRVLRLKYTDSTILQQLITTLL